MKDHLGSIRAVIDESRSVVSAQDYDCWGYIMQDRSYQSSASIYKFTGKERDNESNYDYFGARYYDSRIANWLSVDPLLEKHFDYTPYNYVLRNPIILIDPEGKQIRAMAIPRAIAAEVVIEMAVIATTVYATYKLSEQLVKAYEEYKTTTLSPEATQEKVQITQDANVSNPTYESKAETKTKTAKEHIRAKEKRSKSYHEELANKTYEEIKKIAKDKNDPMQQAAKQMKKLIEKSQKLLEKLKEQGRF